MLAIPPTLWLKWWPSLNGSLTVCHHALAGSGSSHPDAESTHLQDLLIVLRLRLLHLGRGIDIILQIRTHMLQRAKALNEDVGGLPKPSLARPKSNPGTPSTYLAAIRVGNGLIIADRRLAGDGGVGAAQGAGALRETRLRGAGGGRHDGCGGGGWASFQLSDAGETSILEDVDQR